MTTIENNWAKLAIVGVTVFALITYAIIVITLNNNPQPTNPFFYISILTIFIISCGWAGYCAKKSHEVDVLNTKNKNQNELHI